MEVSVDETTDVAQVSLFQKTKNFLWDSARTLAEGNPEISRDMVHSINESLRDEESDLSRATCKKCGAIRDVHNTTYRLKPKKKFNKSVQKAMKRRKIHTSNSKRDDKLLKQFVNSTSTMIIRCKSCSFVEKVSTSSRSDICAIRNKEKQRNKKKPTKTSVTSAGIIWSSTPNLKRKSVENFINTSINSNKSLTPLSTPRNKRLRSSHLSQLLSKETTDSPSTSLMDFLTNLQQ